ncbi:MAG: type III-B CRISPR module-associated protein Cmr3 [Deltaproteobacteria bacterium]|nr:type III-B CRISPR module-associated protein Cmr3 [Deltaproteobacteria bacterium]
MSDQLFIEPLDVLYLRGNRLFGDPGDHAEALMPPWPSVFAGALRSRMLADDHDTDFADFAEGKKPPTGQLKDCIGTPTTPGSFRISRLSLARKSETGTVLPFLPLPADLVSKNEKTDYLFPRNLHAALASSVNMPMLPILAQEKTEKPDTGRWLDDEGLAAYLAGRPIGSNHLVKQETLWREDPRLGIALDASTRTAEEGRIYTTSTVAMAKAIGFLVGVEGAGQCLPQCGLLRLGGDGRGALIQHCNSVWPIPPWQRIEQERRFRMVLLTPGIFPDGWKPPGLMEKNDRLLIHGNGFVARLVAAAVKRPYVVSGWDLARNAPKPAQKAVPSGSVYWFDSLEGKIEDLQQLEKSGLWHLTVNPDPIRKAEGFNHILIAAWPQNP